MWRRMVSEISLSLLGNAMPRTPIEVRPWNTLTSVTGKRMHWPPAAVSSTSSCSVQICTSTIASSSSSFMAMMPERRPSTKRDRAVLRCPCSKGEYVDQRLAAAVRRRHRQPPDLFLVDLAARGEEQHRRMGRSHEQSGDKILVAGLHARPALAAAALRTVGRQRHALDVAGMRDRDHHVLALDQVLVLDLVLLLGDLGLARSGEVALHLGEFGLDDGLHAGARTQDVEVVGDLNRQLVE